MSAGCGGDCQCDSCCAGVAVATPVSVSNRPGLPRLAYRVGTHPQFTSTMRARLASAAFPALARLTTRAPDDFGIALLDGWATIGDVLTFYTERIANEGFLRTATEEFSVRRLAELVGYRPRPGLSASTHLAFTVSGNQGVPIPTGTRAQQVPGPGQLPATFETAEPLTAYGPLSALPIRREQPQYLSAVTLDYVTRLTFVGNLTDLRRDDGIVVRLGSSGPWASFTVTAVEADAATNRTNVSVVVRGSDVAPEAPAPRVVLKDPPPPLLKSLVDALRKPPSVPPSTSYALKRDVRDLLGAGKAAVNDLLGAFVPEIGGTLDNALGNSSSVIPEAPGVSRMRQSAMMFGAVAPKFPKYDHGQVTGYVDPKVTALKVESPGAHARPEEHPAIKPPDYQSSETLDLDGVYPGITAGTDVVLINSVLMVNYPEAIKRSVWYRTVVDVSTVTVSMLGISLKVTRLTLDAKWPFDRDPGGDGGNPDLDLHDVLDNTVVLAQPEGLQLAGESLDDVDIGCVPDIVPKLSDTLRLDMGSVTCGDTLELDGLYPQLAPGRWLTVSGERTDAAIKEAQTPGHFGTGPTGIPGGELVMVAAVEHRPTRILAYELDQPETVDLPGDTVHTFVRLSAPLEFTYRRSTVVIHGNVVRATHGETRREVLGSGDPAKRFARYPLKQPPLTYLAAPTASGAADTLDVYIDSVRWHQADSLLDVGPDDRGYVVDTDDGGNTTVVFGAARPPSGPENIQARYRSGTGLSGNTAAATIITPLDQPLGVTAVTNPLPATGGADRDGREVIRRNAAVSVQALDRLVSVSDYADFACAFAGVGAASATELSDGLRMVVHVTIAGIDDAPIAPGSDLTLNLRAALRELGDPSQEVYVAVRTLRALVLSARVRIDADRDWVDVEPAVRTKLLTTFGPGSREIARGVAQSEVLAAVQAVPGVVFVDLTVLDSVDEQDLVGATPKVLELNPLVRAEGAVFAAAGAIAPAELVVLVPSVPDTLILEAI
jgi:uncharacterized phage protein gp47/JayE